MSNAFHQGEIYVQERFGERPRAIQNLGATSNFVAPGAAAFLMRQPMLVITSHSPVGAVWVSILFGQPGFVSAPDGLEVSIDLGRASINPNDPIWTNLKSSDEVGLLVVDITTRKRLRVIGRAKVVGDKILVRVEDACPLCPKYIQRRHISLKSGPVAAIPGENDGGQELNAELEQILATQDTAFIGSRNPDLESSDASHRGGPKGFIQVLDAHTLRIPDYPGNGMFNTFGNLHLHPNAGITVLSFDHRKILQMTGKGEIRWDLDGDVDATLGTSRLWDFHLESWNVSPIPEWIKWEGLDESPYNPLATLQ